MTNNKIEIFIYIVSKRTYMADIVTGPRPIPILRFMGIFDYDGLYDLIYSWFKDNQYNVQEKKHEFKPTKAGKDIKIIWEGDRKVTGYVKYLIMIELEVYDFKPVEVIENDVKKKKCKGRVEIRITAQAELDYENKWETSEFNLKLRSFMHKYLLKYYIAFKVWDPFYYKIFGLLTNIKQFLNMDTAYSAY